MVYVYVHTCVTRFNFNEYIFFFISRKKEMQDVCEIVILSITCDCILQFPFNMHLSAGKFVTGSNYRVINSV